MALSKYVPQKEAFKIWERGGLVVFLTPNFLEEVRQYEREGGVVPYLYALDQAWKEQ